MGELPHDPEYETIRTSPAARAEAARPLLMVDIDGVISLFGAFGHASALRGAAAPDGAAHTAAAKDAAASHAAAHAGAAPDAAAHDQAPSDGAVQGAFHSIDGMPHFLSVTAAAHLLELAQMFELVWASGWEEKADEHLPHLLGLPAGLPCVRFGDCVGPGASHWKLSAIAQYAGERPLAWVDDALTDACERWAAQRAAPTLLVATDPKRGLTAREARQLEGWARQLAAR
jgi:hypothetical protein